MTPTSTLHRLPPARVFPAACLLLLASAAPLHAGGAATAPRVRPPAAARAERPVAAAPVSEGGPQLFLSWHRPWGAPGASAVRRPACADTSEVDTLYLCLRPGVNMPSFVGFTAEIRFHAERPETLGTYWHFERGAENASGLSVRFRPEPGERDWLQPWRGGGNGGVGWVRAPGTGALRMIYAVGAADSVPLVGDRVYTLASVAVQARRAALTGCAQGVALELARVTLATNAMHEYVVRSGGVRFAASGARGVSALARLWHSDEQAARWRLARVEPGGAWPPPAE